MISCWRTGWDAITVTLLRPSSRHCSGDTMDKATAKEKHRQAKRLYGEKRYAEALAVLDELDRAFPDERNVLYPRARCLAKMGRREQALALCEQLVMDFGDPRAARLKSKLTQAVFPVDLPVGSGQRGGAQAVESFEGAEALALPDRPFNRVARPAPPKRSRLLLIVLIMAGVFLITGVGAAYFWYTRYYAPAIRQDRAPAPPSPRPAAESSADARNAVGQPTPAPSTDGNGRAQALEGTGAQVDTAVFSEDRAHRRLHVRDCDWSDVEPANLLMGPPDSCISTCT